MKFINSKFRFGEALEYLQFPESWATEPGSPNRPARRGIRLPHWGADVMILCQRPDERSKMTHPYLYADSASGRVPWIPTCPEMFSTEWEVWGD